MLRAATAAPATRVDVEGAGMVADTRAPGRLGARPGPCRAPGADRGAFCPLVPTAYAGVPVGRCSAVLVRCRTSHFERPATPSAMARSAGGHVVGRPSR